MYRRTNGRTGELQSRSGGVPNAPTNYLNEELAGSTLGIIYCLHKKKNNSVALVRKRTIPTERPPLVGEVGANLCA
jgi:hypothetical protein